MSTDTDLSNDRGTLHGNQKTSTIEPQIEGMRVLAVDDSKHIRNFLAAILEREGVKILCVPSGADAIKLCKTNTFDLIFIDIRMPEMDGFETFSRIRLLGADTPVVAFSADDSDQVTGQGVDFTDFLPKPIDRDRLLAKVRMYAHAGPR